VWAAVLLFGLGTAIDPLRFGLTALLVSRPRPAVNLLAFWLGGMTAGIGVATAVLLIMRDFALDLYKGASASFQSATSSVTIFAGGRLHVSIGVLALLLAAFLVVRQRTRVPVHAGGSSPLAVLEPCKPSAMARVSAGFEAVMERGFVWGAFVAGLGMATPPAECLLVLTMIMASGAAVSVQFSAFVTFILLLLAVVEIPLIAYLAVPGKTEIVMRYLDGWIRAHRPQITQTILIVAGVAFVVQGIGRL